MSSESSRPLVPLRQDITRVTLAVLFIGSLLVASFLVMQLFLPAIVWATTLVLATWPLLLWLQRHTGNRRGLAVLIMTLTLLLLVIVPFWLALSTVITNLETVGDLIRTILSLRPPPVPDWLAGVPLVGARAAEAWEKLNSASVQELLPRLTPYAGTLTYWFASATGSLGGMFIHFLLTTAIAAVMYSGGERAAATAIRFGRRLGGARGETAVRLAGQAIRSVALGVVVTAVAQSAVAGIGLAVAGVPYAAVLMALIFILCLIQLGPALVMAPAVIWMYYSGDALWATVLLVFTIVAGTMDQFIRPVLIRRGADLPMLLILAGVIGGLIAFGILGIFIGPTVLAVAYTLLNAWMAECDEREPPVETP
ncbi:AI-2E family transporter YdiK [Mesorhizobium sp. LHD-90]|uniref:AI-2E family transporter YdiK n=1 Tax=Mesorhizobium sp. LHD-90 TaxID=3071414 RepID=UPI0027DEE456|nr:AI-2E family transporter YdiK [Mesorhizobium sp. LHD-90]MDQ6436372.1 AI-2E family transporter YdiK [Mesorhizobium sp. LHD-90]